MLDTVEYVQIINEFMLDTVEHVQFINGIIVY